MSTLAAAVAFSALWSVICNLVIDLLQQTDFGLNLGRHPNEALLSAALAWVVLGLLISLTGRLWVSAALLLALTLTLGFTNRLKLEFRREPLFPSDISFGGQVGFLSSVVGRGTILALLLLVALSVFAVLLVGRLASRRFIKIEGRNRRQRLILVGCRVVAAVACLSVLVYASGFNRPENRLRRAYEATGAFWVPYDQSANYHVNGFVAGLLYNTAVQAMETPTDYTRGTMRRIAEKYTALATRMNAGRDANALDGVNVVMVLSESFSDPTRLEGVQLNDDPIPYTHSLMEQTESGTMLAQGIGGGTANMEFEALTGMSIQQFAPQMQIPYQMLVPGYSSFPSAVGYFRAHRHDAVAIHPFNTSMYQRRTVYSTLGFQKFVFDDTMQSRKKVPASNYISDAAAFHEVEHQIAASSQPLFVNLVTMQNHTPWKSLAKEPFSVSGLATAEESHLPDVEAYVRGINHSDQALRELVAHLSSSHEKTVVLLYGDHLPSLWPASVHAANGERRMHETPFVLWSNFSALPRKHVTIASPTHFLPMILDAVNAPIPPYYALLDAVARKVPAMDSIWMLDPDGNQLDESHLSKSAREVLHDYRLVQYDLSIGRRYSQPSMFYATPQSRPTTSASR